MTTGTRQRKKPSPIAVGGTSVRLPRSRITATPTLRHRCTARYGGFADVDGLWSFPPITHQIDVTLSQDGVDADTEKPWDRLVTLITPERIDHEECVRIGSIEVEEFPARFCSDLNTTWSDWLDSMDGDLARAGELADELVESGDDGVLLNGSLFYIRQVDVHPAFAGQQLGARLVAHSLWSLSRSEFDVAMLIAKPVTGQFREGEPDCSEAAVRRLVSYYQRMGFERSRPGERISDADAVLMHALVGIYQLPFRGIGGMGITHKE